MCVRRVRLDVQLDLNVQLEALVYNLSSVLVTTTAFSSPPGFVRIDASLLSTLSSESTDSTPCRFHRKSGVPVLNFAICSLSRCSFSHVCLVVRSASAGIQRLLFTGNVVSPFVLLYFNILLVLLYFNIIDGLRKRSYRRVLSTWFPTGSINCG